MGKRQFTVRKVQVYAVENGANLGKRRMRGSHPLPMYGYDLSGRPFMDDDGKRAAVEEDLLTLACRLRDDIVSIGALRRETVVMAAKLRLDFSIPQKAHDHAHLLGRNISVRDLLESEQRRFKEAITIAFRTLRII